MPQSQMVKPKDLTHKRAGKYRNKITKFDGHTFDSLSEAARYVQLRKKEQRGQLLSLRVHPRFPLIVMGVKVGVYEGDFEYGLALGGYLTVEDVKGHITPTYRLKAALFRVLYPDISFFEIPAKTLTRAAAVLSMQLGYGCTAEQILAREPDLGVDPEHQPEIHAGCHPRGV